MTLRAECSVSADTRIRVREIAILGLIRSFANLRTWGASPSLYGNECWSFANLVLFEGSQILQPSDVVAKDASLSIGYVYRPSRPDGSGSFSLIRRRMLDLVPSEVVRAHVRSRPWSTAYPSLQVSHYQKSGGFRMG